MCIIVRSFTICQGQKREERQQINKVTSYIDGRMIYGSADSETLQIRNQRGEQFQDIVIRSLFNLNIFTKSSILDT